MLRTPPHILVTTPESLYLLLTAEAQPRDAAHVRTVIVDEIHAVIGTRRGAHLALSLERLQHVGRRSRCSASACRRRRSRSTRSRASWSDGDVGADGAPTARSSTRAIAATIDLGARAAADRRSRR